MEVKKPTIQNKNHFVPAGYLKNWADPDGKIFVYRTLVENNKINHWRKHHVNSIAYIKNLYTRKIAFNDNDELEKWFNKEFESPALSTIKKVISDKQLTSSDWNTLIKYLACQDIRTPVRLIEHIEIMKKILPETLEEVMKDISKELSIREKIKNAKNDKLTGYDSFPLKIEKRIDNYSEYGSLRAMSYVGRASWFFSIKYLLENTSIKLHNHKWSIIKPHPGLHWPTSDNPVIKLNYLENGEYDLKGGWDVRNGVIFLPLGPKHAMFLQVGTKSFKKRNVCTEMETLVFTKFICENSHRMIFSSKTDENVIYFKERVISAEQVKMEKEQFSNWIKENEKLEKEFHSGD